MAWTQQELDALDKAIATGVTEVRHNNRTVRYRSLDEMMRARNAMAAELGQAQGPRRRSVIVGKGL